MEIVDKSTVGMFFDDAIEHGLQITVFGVKRYFRNYKLHRKNGPAVEYPDGRKYWWYEGNHILCNSQEEFKRLIKIRTLW
jgi:hypothetical protein